MRGVFSTALAAAFGAAVSLGQSTCSNTDAQVVVYRYTDKQCSAADETIALYQSGNAVIESSSVSKSFTCCDDMTTVAISSTTSSGTTTSSVTVNKCMSGGDVAGTGSTATEAESSYMFECISHPTVAAITINVYGGSSDCTGDPTSVLPAYEGCNEDFPVIMDLTCTTDNDVEVLWSPTVAEECALLQYDENPQYFTLKEGCNLADPDAPFFGIFTAPIGMTSNCGQLGMSPGGTAALVIIILLLLGGGAFAWWWFRIRKPPSSVGVDFTEYNEYSQLDGGGTETDLL